MSAGFSWSPASVTAINTTKSAFIFGLLLAQKEQGRYSIGLGGKRHCHGPQSSVGKACVFPSGPPVAQTPGPLARPVEAKRTTRATDVLNASTVNGGEGGILRYLSHSVKCQLQLSANGCVESSGRHPRLSAIGCVGLTGGQLKPGSQRNGSDLAARPIAPVKSRLKSHDHGGGF
jgi:hypothetical protein